ncbi:conserved exported hypothetical protein [Xenorhabdus bovienii str. oregonense]|uniref:Uncharacterized protein n=1 Tax=Xenorhabdus bovienii str. oregonense TaxID=1398202 RepID=A0A077PB64_XENBV|nr:hypothetical protein [Xenorhabdus bovienii]CDH07958.1 conserved exported hypothetical protein [Xenorhabdus bovienii str. oregonense]
MDLGLIVAVIGVAATIIGIFTSKYFAESLDDKKQFRQAADAILLKLTEEMRAIESGAYPFQTIKDTDFDKLLVCVSPRKRRKLQAAIKCYENTHKSTAKIKHYHDIYPSNSIYRLNSYVVINPEEVIKDLSALRDLISKN